jgi:protocatechuate 3,4-dioxygenase, alpha subunit
LTLAPTPSQTVGPFFGFALPFADSPNLLAPDAPGALRFSGRVLDGSGEPVGDAMIEIWQANANGRYHHPADARERVALTEGFDGFGRCCTDAEGRYSFVSVKPGRVPGPGGALQAPHISLGLFARGLLKRLATRIYFPDEEEANADDPVLALLPDDAARATLVAVADEGGLRFDIRLQGDRQTAFFDV